MNFDINILDGVMKLIVGITKIASPLLMKIPVLILIVAGFVGGFFGLGSMEFMKYLNKTKITMGLLIVIIILLLRGG